MANTLDRRFINQFERCTRNPKLIPPPNGIERWAEARELDELKELYKSVEANQ